MLNECPDTVFSRAAARDPDIKAIGDVDTVAIVLTFPSGAIATVHLSRHSTYHYDQRLEVHGERGMLSCGNPPADSVSTDRERPCDAVVVNVMTVSSVAEQLYPFYA